MRFIFLRLAEISHTMVNWQADKQKKSYKSKIGSKTHIIWGNQTFVSITFVSIASLTYLLLWLSTKLPFYELVNLNVASLRLFCLCASSQRQTITQIFEWMNAMNTLLRLISYTNFYLCANIYNSDDCITDEIFKAYKI